MRILASLSVLVAVLAVGYRAHSEEAPQDAMQKMQSAMALTEHHEALGRLAGTWSVEMRIAGMGAVRGTAEADWLFEGRWMQMTITIPNFMGRTFESHVVMGYDKVKKAHVAVAFDNMGPGLKAMAGPTVDASGDLQVMYGENDEYLTGELDKPVKYVTRWLSDDKWTFEVIDLGIGENGRVVVTETFTRKK